MAPALCAHARTDGERDTVLSDVKFSFYHNNKMLQQKHVYLEFDPLPLMFAPFFKRRGNLHAAMGHSSYRFIKKQKQI